MNPSSSASIGSRVVLVEGVVPASSSASLVHAIARSARISSNDSRSIDPSRSHGRVDVVVAVIAVDARRRVDGRETFEIQSNRTRPSVHPLRILRIGSVFSACACVEYGDEIWSDMW